MKMTRTLAFAAIGMVLTAAPLHTQDLVAAPSPQPALNLTSTTTMRSMIAGTVSDPHSKPIANALVRLRNLETGRIDQTAVTNTAGEFRLVAAPEIPYVVEFADAEGRIVSISDVIIAHVGEIASTALTAGARLPALARVFGKTTGSVIAAIAGFGVPAVRGGPPLSPEK